MLHPRHAELVTWFLVLEAKCGKNPWRGFFLNPNVRVPFDGSKVGP